MGGAAPTNGDADRGLAALWAGCTLVRTGRFFAAGPLSPLFGPAAARCSWPVPWFCGL